LFKQACVYQHLSKQLCSINLCTALFAFTTFVLTTVVPATFDQAVFFLQQYFQLFSRIQLQLLTSLMYVFLDLSSLRHLNPTVRKLYSRYYYKPQELMGSIVKAVTMLPQSTALQ
jgi:hypothetical protein